MVIFSAQGSLAHNAKLSGTFRPIVAGPSSAEPA
jgi:hypothetical protein